MADLLELILQVCPAPGDDAGELAGWLRGELLDLDVQTVDWLQGKAVPVGAKGSPDIDELLLIQLDPNALQVVLVKVADWMARSDRMVEISARDYTLKLGRPTRQRQEKVIDVSLVPSTEVRPEGQTEAVIEATPSVVPNPDSAALEPGKELVLFNSSESLPPIRRSPREKRAPSRRNRLADACIFAKGGINVEALPEQESRRTVTFAGISSFLASSFAVFLAIAILAIAKHFRGFSISTHYPVHKVYQETVRYLIHITPHPGNDHMVVVYSVYLAVLPVLFAVVFMLFKAGSDRLIFATLVCFIFMVAPFIIAVTSVKHSSTNCGSWIYPARNSGSECYNDLEIFFRIAFAVGVIGLIIPMIYLFRERRRGHGNGLLLRALTACASVVMLIFNLISGLVRRQKGGDRDIAPDQKALAAVEKYLLPHERQFITIRRHPAVLIGPSMLTLAWLVAAGVLTATILYGNKPLATVVWIAWLMLFVRLIWKYLNWTLTFLVITSQRILLTSGVLTAKVVMLPLAKVTDMSLERSYIGRLLGFGQFIMASVDQDQGLRTVDHVPYPEQLYLEICGLIFRGTEEASSDED